MTCSTAKGVDHGSGGSGRRKAGRRKGGACAGERMRDEGGAEGEGGIQEPGVRRQETGDRSQESGVGARERFDLIGTLNA